jgi:putative transcriptional regulator
MKPEEVRKLRESLGMTQAELAEYLGLETRGAVSRLETGDRRPTGPVLRLLHILEQTGGKTFLRKP